MSSTPYGDVSGAYAQTQPPPYAGGQPQYGQQGGYGQQAGYGLQAYPQQSYPPQYGYPAGGQVVTVLARQPPPPTYLAWSVISLIFFCLPLGIAALVMSLAVSNDSAVGQHVEAHHKSSIARTLNIIATVLGLVIYVTVGAVVGVASRYVYVYG